MIDVGDDRIPGNSQLRDNEWMFAEFLKQAEEENKRNIHVRVPSF